VYAGQPVVAVAAGTPADAAAAASLVGLRYEVLPAVLDAEGRWEIDAPIRSRGWASNVMWPDHRARRFASVAAEADHVVEGELRIQRSLPYPDGDAAYLADWDRRVTEPTGTAHPRTRTPSVTCAAALRMEEQRIRVITRRPVARSD